MKKAMMARLRSRCWWIIATLFLLGLNFAVACGDSPTESRQFQKEEKEEPPEKK